MKDRQTCLRLLDEIDNAIMIMHSSIERGMKIDPLDAKVRFQNIRQKFRPC